jgi:tetratricopeptide (TPR) repeat protein
MQARLLAAVGKYEKAEKFLRRLLYETVAGSESSVVRAKKTALTRQAGLVLIEILISSGELVKAEQQCLAMLGAGRDAQVLVLLQKIYELDERTGVAKNISSQLINGARDDSELLGLARMFGEYGLVASQIMAAEKVLLSNPGSLPAGFILAEALVARGKGPDTLKLLTGMAELYPDNTSIIFAMARYYYGAGQYASALQHSNRFLERNPGRLDAQHLKLKCITALGEYDHAKDLVSQLFPERTATLLEKSITEAGLKLDLPQPKRTFLQTLTFSSVSAPSVTDELMRVRYLADNSTDEQIERNTLAVPLYSRYRWEQEFRKTVADQ